MIEGEYKPFEGGAIKDFSEKAYKKLKAMAEFSGLNCSLICNGKPAETEITFSPHYESDFKFSPEIEQYVLKLLHTFDNADKYEINSVCTENKLTINIT